MTAFRTHIHARSLTHMKIAKMMMAPTIRKQNMNLRNPSAIFITTCIIIFIIKIQYAFTAAHAAVCLCMSMSVWSANQRLLACLRRIQNCKNGKCRADAGACATAARVNAMKSDRDLKINCMPSCVTHTSTCIQMYGCTVAHSYL